MSQDTVHKLELRNPKTGETRSLRGEFMDEHHAKDVAMKHVQTARRYMSEAVVDIFAYSSPKLIGTQVDPGQNGFR
jgi:hypothetical protein